LDFVLDDREIGGLSGTDKIEHIERIQSRYRGIKARKFVTLVKTVMQLKRLVNEVD